RGAFHRVNLQRTDTSRCAREETSDAQGLPNHDPNRLYDGDLGWELARTCAVPSLYQGPRLRARITAKLQCLLQSRPGTRGVGSMGRTAQPKLVHLSMPRWQDPVR